MRTFYTISSFLWWTCAAASDVVIDARTAFQKMDGFGSSERAFDDPHVFNNFNAATMRAQTTMTAAQQNAVMDKLYVDLRFTRVRPVCPETQSGVGIEPVNDNSDPNQSNLSSFNFAWKNLDVHMDYVARARQRGVTTWFVSPLNRETWMGTTSTNDVAEYAEWLLAQALRCQTLGHPLPYISVSNEPSYTRNTMSGAFIRDVIKLVGPKLRAAGLETRFVVPDDVRSSNAATKTQTIMSDPIARQYVGAMGTHLYDEPLSNLSQMQALAAQYSVPLWMTEYPLSLAGSLGQGGGPFDWCNLIHELLGTYNVSAVEYMWGFFGQWENKSQLVVLNHSTSGAMNYTGYTLTKEYYVTGQYSRFVLPGSRRVLVSGDDATIKVTAFVNWPQLTIVAYNSNTSGNATVPFSIVGLPSIASVNAVRTSDTENWATLPEIAVSGSSFTTTLPHRSVTTFTATLPSLTLRPEITGNNVLLAWPSGAAGFALQFSDDLSAWADIAAPPVEGFTERSVSLPMVGQRRFYRLVKQ